MENLERIIEALIFSSDKPVGLQELINVLTRLAGADEFIETATIEKALASLTQRYASNDYAFSLEKSGGGYQFLSKPDYHEAIHLLIDQRSKKRLSAQALETLSIIAYKQPITKSEIERIRGVNCDYTLNKLLDRGLILIAGRDKSPGRPILYTTSDTFMDYFGINSVDDLPRLKDIHELENVIGEPDN